MRRFLMLVCVLVLNLFAGRSTAEDCPAPRVCTTGEAINASADALCRRARSAETRLPSVIDDLAAAQAQRDVCTGRLAQLTEHPPVVKSWRAPLWLRLALDVGVGALGAGTGVVAGIGGPPEVIVGLAVGSVAALLARVVLEVIR